MSTTAPGATHNTLESGTFLHPFTDFAEYKNQGGKTYVRGEGIFIIDHLGNRLLDGMSGLWCTNLGYLRTVLKLRSLSNSIACRFTTASSTAQPTAR
jgi:adenosylmethionine-8-amino-7-oxononanoate aminotransferase